MTREEIKQEILNDEQQQFKIVTSATFTALYHYLIKKGILTKEDIDALNKLITEYVNKLNEITIDKVMNYLEKESE